MSEETAADLLDALLRERRMTQRRFAHQAGISRKHVSDVLIGQSRIGPRMAALCQRALGGADLAERLLVAQAREDAARAVADLPWAPYRPTVSREENSGR